MTELTARRYVDDNTIRHLAQSMAFAVVDERPGADLMTAERDAMIAYPFCGIVIAALTEAMRVRVANAAAAVAVEEVQTHAQLITLFGLYLGSTRGEVGVPVATAALARGARYLDNAAAILEAGGHLADDSSDPLKIAASFRDDAELMRGDHPRPA